MPVISALLLACALGAPEPEAVTPPPLAPSRRSAFAAAGPFIATYHGLELRGAAVRGGVRSRPGRLVLFGETTVPSSLELGLEVASSWTPNGLMVADTVATWSVVLGEAPFRGVLGCEAGLLWFERATRGEVSRLLVAGPRAAFLLEFPVRSLGGLLTLELGLRLTSADHVRGGLLVGLAR